ncbi:MAG: D-2-hydroxyacid dehydrogenase [Lachnospiraceae bacterium]
MKIVILDSLTLGSDICLDQLKTLGDVTVYETSTQEQASKRLEDADIAIVNKVPMNEESLKNASKLKMIALTATGYNNVDFEYTRAHNITVANVRGYSTASVVQHTFALMFYVMEKLSYYDQYVKSGEYAKCPVFTHFDKVFMELTGKTWGIIGLGEIGRGVAKIAQSFGCRVIYYSASGKNNNPDYERVSFEELLAQSDILTIHAPLNAATENLMNYEAFKKMKKSSILVNVGRGPIVNEADLARALNEDLIAGAALDVVCKEPITSDCPLNAIKDSSKLIITPHIAWATYEARSRLMDEVYKNIESFLKGEERNVIS